MRTNSRNVMGPCAGADTSSGCGACGMLMRSRADQAGLPDASPSSHLPPLAGERPRHCMSCHSACRPKRFPLFRRSLSGLARSVLHNASAFGRRIVTERLRSRLSDSPTVKGGAKQTAPSLAGSKALPGCKIDKMTTLEYIRSNHFRITSIASISMDPSDIPEKRRTGEGCFRFWPIPSKEGRASRKDVEPSAIGAGDGGGYCRRAIGGRSKGRSEAGTNRGNCHHVSGL